MPAISDKQYETFLDVQVRHAQVLTSFRLLLLVDTQEFTATELALHQGRVDKLRKETIKLEKEVQDLLKSL